MIKRLWPIVRKEYLHLVRDPRSLALMFLLPVMMLVLFGYAVSFDVRNIPTAVYDQSRSAASRGLVGKFLNSGYFRLAENLTSDRQFADRLDRGAVRVIINVPNDFDKKIAAGQTADLQILVDGADPTYASSALSYIGGIVQAYQQGLTRARLPIDLKTRVWYNETLRSINFFVPGLIVVILMQMSATLTSLTIVSEKEQGTLEALVVSPVRKNELMLGKIVPYVLVAFFDIIIVTLLGVFLFGVPLKGNFFFMLVSSFVFLTGAMSLGLLISNVARTGQEAMQASILATMLPGILLSGFVFPIENMPWIIQGLSYLIPARYYLSIVRSIFLKGTGLAYLWPDFLMMLALSVILLAASVRRFRKRLE
ncbi:MAG: ABC transporter permease [Candidatus Saganbacteria bacterium]|nr:ABC transporter permease [Candidatus Saganbacteria bacterium]